MKKIIIPFAILALTLFGISCERDNVEEEGPQLLDLFADFTFVEPFSVAQKSADFSSGEKITFNAKFNKLANWNLTITGLSSNSKKMFEGTTNELNVDNASWDGSTSQIPIFKEEDCVVDFWVLEDSTHYFDTISITGTKINDGFLIADFESGQLDPDWTGFVQSGANMSFVVSSDTTAAQGDFYYDMGGAVGWDYLIGLIDFPASAYDVPHYPLSENANNVFFNAMIYNPPGITNGFFVVQFQEDDNGNGVFNASNEDGYQFSIGGPDGIVTLKPGWQLISVPYSEMVIDGQNGNKTLNPDKVIQMSILFLADPTSGYSQGYLDYVIFTENGPLNP